MKRFYKLIACIVMVITICAQARAQYYEITNQLSQLISPALSGSLSYKGFVEASGLAGVGTSRANFLGVSTSQGFKYSNWFFMGVGIGVDVVMASVPDEYPLYDIYGKPSHSANTASTKAMIPVFTDFRLNIGDMSKTGIFIDLKLGAAWLLGDSYLRLQEGCVTTGTQFYLRPTLGVRLPVNKNNAKQAFNIGVTYQLLTANSNYYVYDNNSLSLNNVGLTLGYEW